MRAQTNAEEMPSAVNGGERQENLGKLKNNCTEKMNDPDCVTEPPCPHLGTSDVSTENDTFSPYAIHELIVATAEAIVQKHNSRQTTNDCNASVKFSLSQSVEGIAVHEKGVLLQRKLDQLRPEQRSCLALKDDNGCTTVHLAARFGLLEFCEIILSRMLAWGLLADNIYFSCLWEKDNSGNIPLHYSVKSGQFEMTRLLIDSMKLARRASESPVAKLISLSSVLNLAALGDHPDVLRVLLSSNEFDINWRDSENRTALHTAVALGHVGVVKILLSSRPSVEIEAVDVNSLTPLTLACINGHLEMVELLVNAGADVKKLDASNWSARDHALYNGHMAVSNRLGELLSADPPFPHHPGRSEYYRQNDMLKSAWNQKSCTNSTNETKLVINLGSLNPRKPAKSFEYDALSPIKSELEEKHDMLSMSISLINETGQSQTRTVSLTEDSPSDPVIFLASSLTQAKLIFDLTIEDHPEASKRPIARGATLVSASSLTSLRGRTYIGQSSTLPLMSPPTMDVIGYVNFTSLLVTPFHHPNLLDCGNWTDWENTDGPLIIGHRGLGKNVSNQYHLQLGENTLQSFTAAAKLGAPYIEFDVQLTKDHVPVIYHDYIVSETGVDIPMHTITLKQLRFANSQQSHNFATKDRTSEEPSINTFLRSRSFSMSASNHEQSKILERIKQTNDYKKKGFKSNTRGLHIQETFATLQEMFSKIPIDLGFNIELKYPMLHDTEKEDLDLLMVEMNLYVDSILQVVFNMGKQRNIIFSSFNADVCIMLVMKQPQIPVLFLTNAGTQPVLDIRSRSLRNAVRFASQWGLAGIVSIADPLIASPGLVTHIKDSGFLCLSYGTMNTEIENIKIQAEKGVNGVIVDCLPLVLHEVAQMRQNLKA